MDYFHKAGAKRVVGVAAVLGGLAGAAACADILGVQSDRHLAAVDSAVPVPYGPWDCLQAPDQGSDPGKNIALSIQVNSAIATTVNASQVDGGSSLVVVTSTTLPGVKVVECPNLADPGCKNAAQTLTTDDAGLVTFNVTGGFQGFFQLTRPDLVPYTYYPGNPVLTESSQTIPIGVLTEDGLQAVASFLLTLNTAPSIPPDGGIGTEGMVFFGVYDCHDVYAPGVSVQLVTNGPDTFEYYVGKDDFPTTTATYTTTVAAGGFLNVPLGSATVQARIEIATPASLQGTVLGSVTVPVSAGVVAEVNFRTRTH